MIKGLIVLLLMLVTLAGCYQQPASSPYFSSNANNKTKSAKDPQHIKIVTNLADLKIPYRVLGVARIAKYNFFGKERDARTILAILRKMAARMGGDALFTIVDNQKYIEIKIIAYQKVLL